MSLRLDRRRFLSSCLMGASLLLAGTRTGQPAAPVEEVVGATGVRAWLLREPSIPFVSVAFRFEGGGAHDPEGLDGLTYLASGLLDEGAGPYDSKAFRSALEDNAIRLSFDADRDALTGGLKTLNDTRELAFELLRLALTEPRFDEEPVERIRQQVMAELRRRETDPDYRSGRAWFARAFAGHPYARPTRGTPDTIARIGIPHLRQFAATRLSRDNLVIGVAGDITPRELAPLLDRTFGALPPAAQLPMVPPARPATGGVVVERMAIPQSVVTFGHAGIDRHDPDYYAAYVANYILGGGGFSSRLTNEIREKRGLAYSVYSYLYDSRYAPLWLGGVATRNDQVATSIELVEREAARMAAGELAEQELVDAKTYLTGSFPLRLTSNDRIAEMLVAMQAQELGIDYLDKRNGYIEAVTLADTRRAAARLFAGPILFSVVGDPVGLEDRLTP
ncbi:putative zinc protease [bacterium HR40]|nr:putative zinc protease [bacterium HR40]